ncbi:MAG: endopeptidase La [Clostridia bacterium]|nr:endopeptidase La [Clostridia bacterium]
MDKNFIFSMVPLRGVSLFPGMTLHFDVGRRSSLAALKNANGQDIFFVTQKDVTVEKPEEDDLYPIGVVGTVRQIIKLPEQSSMVRVVVEGKYRAKIDEFVQKRLFYKVKVSPLEDNLSLPTGFEGSFQFLEEASLYSTKRFFDEYAEHIRHMSPEMFHKIYESKDLGELTDYIAGNIMLSMEDKQTLLGELNIFARSELLCAVLAKETQILELDAELQDRVQEQMDKNQREYYLREEMKAITEELGELEGDDSTGLMSKIRESLMPEELKEKLYSEIERLKRMSPSSADGNVLRSYIEKCLDIPWGKYTKENTSLIKAKKVLEKDHYGLKEVKERITEMLAALMVSPDIKGQIICLAGPPGVGKTSVARSIAQATNRKYVRISLGGVRDEAEIRGHRKTYIGSMPGRIINALTEAGSMNCLMLLDEIDKLGSDFKGDPASALLEVLDGEQNFAFRDHYIELPVDLSKVLFITTANDKHMIPDALRDRMEIIDLPSYTYEEKFSIAKKHLIPKQMKEHSLTKENFKITDAALRIIIDGYTREAGVRILERKIASLCRKETVRLASGNTEKLEITDKNLEEFLGIRKYRPEENVLEDNIGVVNGLAWTSVGGELLKAEAVVLDGTGKIEYTGSLGDVMKESVRTAVSYVRSRADRFSINPDFYKENDIHVHFPEGAVPKDGPSAGVTVTTALVSALTGRKVRGSIAMTGEVTLTGRVLPIGGLREKAMAAYREKISTVIIPFGNIPDIEEIDEAVKKQVEFIPVKNVDEVIDIALYPEFPPKKEKSKTEKLDTVIPSKNNREGLSCKRN